MRWNDREIRSDEVSALPGMAKLANLVRSVQTPEFAGMTFHEVAAKSALNKVQSDMPFRWTINPYRGCSHACVYCYARASHRYLDLDTGEDFDSQIVVKVNVVEVLEAELRRSSWSREHVALGSNTDPYQRAEGRYELMPGIIRALSSAGTPFSILTKGTLLRRDLPQLVAASESVSVSLAMSIAVGDDSLQQSIEPGTPTTGARLATVQAAVDRGLDVSVFVMPVLPYLTDSIAQLDSLLERIADAGASSVTYAPLNLRPGVKPWFAQWLARHQPQLVGRYRALFGDSTNAVKSYRASLASRIKPLIAKHGLGYGPDEIPMREPTRSEVAAPTLF